MKNYAVAIVAALHLLADGAKLVGDFKAAFEDPAVAAEVKNNAVVDAEIAKISREWRTVEEAEIKLIHKSSFATVIPNITALVSAARTLEADTVAEEANPEIAAALANMPLTRAALASIDTERKQALADVAALVG